MVGFHESPSPVNQYKLEELLLTILVSSDDWLRPYRGLLPRTDSRSDKDGLVGPCRACFRFGSGSATCKAGYSELVLPPGAHSVASTRVRSSPILRTLDLPPSIAPRQPLQR